MEKVEKVKDESTIIVLVKSVAIGINLFSPSGKREKIDLLKSSLTLISYFSEPGKTGLKHSLNYSNRRAVALVIIGIILGINMVMITKAQSCVISAATGFSALKNWVTPTKHKASG